MVHIFIILIQLFHVNLKMVCRPVGLGYFFGRSMIWAWFSVFILMREAPNRPALAQGWTLKIWFQGCGGEKRPRWSWMVPQTLLFLQIWLIYKCISTIERWHKSFTHWHLAKNVRSFHSEIEAQDHLANKQKLLFKYRDDMDDWIPHAYRPVTHIQSRLSGKASPNLKASQGPRPKAQCYACL